MAPHDKPPRPERSATDQSLRKERSKTDHELSHRWSSLEEDADSVVLRARDTADGVLKTTRDKEDLKLELGAAQPQALASVVQQRQEEDRLLRDERALADRQLQGEREARARILASLLAEERALTDQHLRMERRRSDEAVTSRDGFLGIVSHDLRTMVSAISMTAELLARKAAQEEAGKPLLGGLGQIQQSAVRVQQLIGDLMDVTSIEAGRLAVSPRELEARRVIEDTVEAFQAAALARGLSLETQVPGEPLLARYDYGRIIQVLANLVGNALKFTPAGGRIQVRLAAVKDEVRFSVEDTGIGIPEDAAGRLFERFWKAAANEGPGMGLGLFISRSIVEAHGGRIWAELRPGGGSSFHFTVPGVHPRAGR
jgi:signal transduction histidine kinase